MEKFGVCCEQFAGAITHHGSMMDEIGYYSKLTYMIKTEYQTL